MAPDVVARKLGYLRSLLADLREHAGAGPDDIAREHYRVERILELLVTAAADLLTHLLAEEGEPPGTYRETFRRAGEAGLIGPELSERLQKAAGMRNVLVHLYEEIDLGIVREAVENAIQDFPALITALEPRGRGR